MDFLRSPGPLNRIQVSELLRIKEEVRGSSNVPQVEFVDHVFSLRDQLLLKKDETVELLKQARECQSIDDVLNLGITDPEDFLVHLQQSGSFTPKKNLRNSSFILERY